MSNKLNLLLTFLTLTALSGCALGLTGKQPATSSEYCLIAKPISYDSAHDSPATVKAVEAHNSVWVCVCEHDCPKTP